MEDFFVPTSKDRFIVSGMPSSSLKQYLEDLYASSPIEMLPPVVYFSTPEESIFGNGGPWVPPVGPVSDFEPISVTCSAFSFKNIYNPVLQRTEMCCALLIDDGTSVKDFRTKVLGINYQRDFVPYFVIARDPVRSTTSRSFCLSVANALFKRPLPFDLIPTSFPAIVGNYNPETVSVFPSAP